MAYNNYYQKVVGFSKGDKYTCAEYNVNSCEWIDAAPGSEIPLPLPVSYIRRLLITNRYLSLMKTVIDLRFLSNDIDSILITKNKICRTFCKHRGCVLSSCDACCKGIAGPEAKCWSEWEIDKFKDNEICSGTPRAGLVKEGCCGCTVCRLDNNRKYAPIANYSVASYTRYRGIGGKLIPSKIIRRTGTAAGIKLVNAKEEEVKVYTGKYYNRRPINNSFEIISSADSSSTVVTTYRLEYRMLTKNLFEIYDQYNGVPERLGNWTNPMDENLNILNGESDSWEGEMAKITLREVTSVIMAPTESLLPDGWSKIETETTTYFTGPGGVRVSISKFGGITIDYIKTPITIKADQQIQLQAPTAMSKFRNMLTSLYCGFEGFSYNT
jgi:hypothetical protein